MSGYIGTQPVPQATQTRDAFTATAGQTSFATSGYTPSFLDVFLNGVKLAAADYTASNGSDVVLASGAATGDILEVVAYTTFDTANVTGADDFTVTGSFTSQGIDDNATSTAMTLDGSGNLLVGGTGTAPDTSSTDTGHAFRADGRAGISRDGGPALSINRLTSDGDIMQFRKNGSTVGSIGVGQSDDLYIGTDDTGILTGSNDAICPWNPSTNAGRDNAIDLGTDGLRFKDLYLSGGVYLGGTGSANKLDDYEEGLWTPAVAQGTASTAYGSYTKIGRVVKVIGRISNFSDTSTGQRVQITNLPFTSASGSSYESTGSAFARYTSISAQSVYIPSGGTNAYFYAMAGGDWSNQELDHSDLQNSTADIYWSATYMTT